MISITTATLTFLLPFALAAPFQSGKEPTIFGFAGKHSCPAELRPFRATNIVHFPSSSAEKVWNVIGDGCNLEWQGFELASVGGTCNSAKSLRTYNVADLEITERLDLIHLPASSSSSSIFGLRKFSPHATTGSEIKQTYAQGWTMLNRPQLAGADVIRMKSLLKVSDTENGGSRVEWDVIGCSDYPEHLSDALEEVHDGALMIVKEQMESDSQRFRELVLEEMSFM